MLLKTLVPTLLVRNRTGIHLSSIKLFTVPVFESKVVLYQGVTSLMLIAPNLEGQVLTLNKSATI